MIARAIIARPRVLLFDEATSALDNRTQAIVSKSLDDLQATRVTIAHRLSTIIGADRIYVMEGGRAAQGGKYHELVEQPGLFRDLMRRQIDPDAGNGSSAHGSERRKVGASSTGTED
jgi:ATP-binding cassette subfamily C protein